MIQDIYNSKGFQAALPWIILILGTISLAYGIFGTFENIHWGEFYSILGKTFLTGGIFGVLLKSMQYMGIFRDEIIKVIYDPKFLSNRKDLPELWQKMSTVLFKNKFPKISSKLLTDVSEIYFPTKEISYYENTEHQVEIRIIDLASKIVKITETANLDLVCESTNTKASYMFGHTIGETSTFKLLKFKIDGNENPIVEKENKMIGDSEFELTTASLSGKDKYSIEKSTERIMNIAEDNLYVFSARKILHKIKVQFHHDENVELEIVKLGTIEEYILKKTNSTFKEYQNDGLIYPEQGYAILIKIK